MPRSLLATALLAFVIAACGASSTPAPSVPPSAPPSVEPSATPAAPSPSPSTPPSGSVYIVKKGDTLSAIAARNKTTVKAILAANPDITNANYLKVGQRIVIPAPSPSP
jgi:2',3'-cyclic-nucleotide 2'-phosphodiesterase / 3'-nucleotidase